MISWDKSKGDQTQATLTQHGDDWIITSGQTSLFVPIPTAEGWARRILGLPEDFKLSDTAKAATAVSKAQGGQP